jgi:hypothetical protein
MNVFRGSNIEQGHQLNRHFRQDRQGSRGVNTCKTVEPLLLLARKHNVTMEFEPFPVRCFEIPAGDKFREVGIVVGSASDGEGSVVRFNVNTVKREVEEVRLICDGEVKDGAITSGDAKAVTTVQDRETAQVAARAEHRALAGGLCITHSLHATVEVPQNKQRLGWADCTFQNIHKTLHNRDASSGGDVHHCQPDNKTRRQTNINTNKHGTISQGQRERRKMLVRESIVQIQQNTRRIMTIREVKRKVTFYFDTVTRVGSGLGFTKGKDRGRWRVQ